MLLCVCPAARHYPDSMLTARAPTSLTSMHLNGVHILLNDMCLTELVNIYFNFHSWGIHLKICSYIV